MWHLVCGDNAVEGVAFALGETVPRECLRVLRDDLAVGPLKGIEQPPCTRRAAFWRAVWPEAVQPAPDFEAGLYEDARWLAGLAGPRRRLDDQREVQGGAARPGPHARRAGTLTSPYRRRASADYTGER